MEIKIESQNNRSRQEEFDELTVDFMIILNKKSNYDCSVEVRNLLYSFEIKLEIMDVMLRNHFDRQITAIQGFSSIYYKGDSITNSLITKYEDLDKPTKSKIRSIWVENRSKFEEYKINSSIDFIRFMVSIKLYPEQIQLKEETKELIKEQAELRFLWQELEKIIFQEKKLIIETNQNQIKMIISTPFIFIQSKIDYVQNYNAKIAQLLRDISRL